MGKYIWEFDLTEFILKEKDPVKKSLLIEIKQASDTIKNLLTAKKPDIAAVIAILHFEKKISALLAVINDGTFLSWYQDIEEYIAESDTEKVEFENYQKENGYIPLEQIKWLLLEAINGGEF